jgi:hypothetical protein
MRCWVYAARGSRVVVLIASAGTLGSCIAQLEDLRSEGDAGVEQNGVSKPNRETESAPEIESIVDAGSTSRPSAANATRPPSTTPSTDVAGSGTAGSESAEGADDASVSSDFEGARDSGVSAVIEASSSSVDCPLGTATSEGDTAACDACGVGGYCAGGAAPFTVCTVGTWDEDAAAATPCVPKTACLAGYYVSSEGDALTNRTCAECSSGQYSDTLNASSCQPWSECLAPESYQLASPASANDRQCEACPPLAVSLVDNAATCMTLAYQMAAGQVAFEAEHPHFATNTETDVWSTVDVPAISGGMCLEVGPDDRSDWTSDPFSTAPRLDYAVQFEAAGTYYVHVRGDAGASSEGFSDSCYAALDGVVTDWYRFEVVGGTWGWASQPVLLGSAGVHVVSILAREDGFRVDKIVVSTSATPPSGNGPDESPIALVAP